MRANLFFYRDMQDAWLRRLREAPVETLFASLPNLRRLIGDIEVPDPVKVRPVDLYMTADCRKPGVVLVGDAFSTSCPAAGTGVGKVFTDVERLCHVYIPRWLATPGMDQSKISAFYEDPDKTASDTRSLAQAFYARSLSTDPALLWRLQRLGHYLALRALGIWRRPAGQPKPVQAGLAPSAAGQDSLLLRP
jgi:2-polyprenyl-6-methoxyphenol hydroxylase-like FAD-dependent oxidoreductase